MWINTFSIQSCNLGPSLQMAGEQIYGSLVDSRPILLAYSNSNQLILTSLGKASRARERFSLFSSNYSHPHFTNTHKNYSNLNSLETCNLINHQKADDGINIACET